MVTSSAGLGSESDCAGEAQKQLYRYIIGQSSRQRGRLIIRNLQLSRVADGGLIPGQAGRLTVGPKIILTLTMSV
jgi:hypothetical protein